MNIDKTLRADTHAQAIQAIGLLSALAPDVQLNPDDLVGTAQAIVAHVKAQGLPVEPRLKPLADNAELLDRLRERTESHLAASARDVATIQKLTVELASADREIERLKLMCQMLDESSELDAKTAELFALRNTLVASEAYQAGLAADVEAMRVAITEAIPLLECLRGGHRHERVEAALAKLQPFIKP